MITLILDGGLGDELIYRYSPDPVKSGLVAFNRNNGEWRYKKKIEDLPDAYTEMLANAANKVMNATQILQNFVVVFFLCQRDGALCREQRAFLMPEKERKT